jgi:plastocyanin
MLKMSHLGALLALALLTCAGTAAQTQSTPSPAPSPTATPVAIVHTKDFAYSPKELKINVGDAVEFVNDDELAHTVTSNDKTFDSGDLDAHQMWLHTFTKAGTFTYYCTYHPFMQAKIVVTGS